MSLRGGKENAIPSSLTKGVSTGVLILMLRGGASFCLATRSDAKAVGKPFSLR
jgi:hypothetical protein